MCWGCSLKGSGPRSALKWPWHQGSPGWGQRRPKDGVRLAGTFYRRKVEEQFREDSGLTRGWTWETGVNESVADENVRTHFCGWLNTRSCSAVRN